MLLEKISDEFEELRNIVSYNKDGEYKIINDIKFRNENIDINLLLSWNKDIRVLSKVEGVLESKRFTSKIVQKYAYEHLSDIKEIFDIYDELSIIFQNKKDNEVVEMRNYNISILQYCVNNLYLNLEKISLAGRLLREVSEETWEPLPDDEKEDNVNNIVISSETRSMSLNDVASDVGNLDSFLNSICLLINKDKNQSNNIYLRRVETGSLTVAVSCAMQTAPIIAFIFWCVKLYQKAEKRYLDNADKKLKLINDSMESAKKILEVDPDNKEANEIIQKSGIYILDFLENNPIGTINGEHYDIGVEKLKIEKKDD